MLISHSVCLVDLLGACVVRKVDAVACISFAVAIIKQGPEIYHTGYWLGIAGLTVCLLGLLPACLFVVSLVQTKATTLLLAHLMRKYNLNSLSHYIPEARGITTHFALVSARAAFLTMGLWRPLMVHSLVRALILHLLLSSSLVWMRISLAFISDHTSVRDGNLKLRPSYLTDFIRLFATPVKPRRTSRKKHASSPGYQILYAADFNGSLSQRTSAAELHSAELSQRMSAATLHLAELSQRMSAATLRSAEVRAEMEATTARLQEALQGLVGVKAQALMMAKVQALEQRVQALEELTMHDTVLVSPAPGPSEA
ncbi:hypothetical protein LTR53_013080 [Teratosphaeriaceae sp. CCFEE 6253]|nr:hypothetical protein LTR53_013080 [Teratosphaeriaceae sp. CCFEE 6253]